MKKSNEITVRSPGRINLIGEHIDYHGGYAMPAAIDKQVEVSIWKNDLPHQCRVTADNLGELVEFDLRSDFPPAAKWSNYIIGVVRELQKQGADIQGFEASFSGNIPLGAGMSSSAALECAFAFALNELFGLGFAKMDLIKASQMAEHHYVGTKCGIMDQFSSMMGQKEKAILLNCKTLEHKYLPIGFGEHEILILNSNVSHSLADSGYNARRAESEEGLSILQKKRPVAKCLCDVNIEVLAAAKSEMPLVVYRRCEYVLQENARVLAAANALENHDLSRFGELMYATHSGLQYQYEVSCPELDFLVGQARAHPQILGARMMGGGFGGCTINLVHRGFRSAFTELVAKNYRAQFGIDLTPHSISIENGTSLIS